MSAAGEWIPMSQERPPLEKHVLVYGHGHGRTPKVMRLVRSEGIMSVSGAKTERFSFYPGGLDVGWVTHWAKLVAPEGEKLEWCAE